ncbi:MULTISPECIES: hypothetical protein [Streptomyces]|uniref:Uncharacterized protein n=2 Tax=Streptomyces TaxID=1883 RepID=A0ABV9IMX4_9ACTN
MPAGQRHHGVLGGDRDTDETAQPGGGRGRIGRLDHEPGEVVVTAVASAAAVGVANSGDSGDSAKYGAMAHPHRGSWVTT